MARATKLVKHFIKCRVLLGTVDSKVKGHDLHIPRSREQERQIEDHCSSVNIKH